MSKLIREICFACTEPILEDEYLVWGTPHSYGEDEQPYHGECAPSTFFVEEEDVYGNQEQL